MPKSWSEKLHSKSLAKVETLDKPMMGLPTGTRLYIATPLIVQQLIADIPKGQTRTIAQIRESLAQENGADATCPLTTGIFVRIVAEESYERMQEGAPDSEVAPFWRVIEPKSPLAKKFSGGPDVIKALRAKEGIA